VQLDEYGPPDVLHLVEVPDPRPGPGQVVVGVAECGVTFIETQMRAGRSPRPGGMPDPPVVLCNGVEGEVVAVGVDVDASQLGRHVVTATGGFGGYADRVVVGLDDLIAIPDGLAVGEAVALLADGRTALGLVRAAAIGRDDRVLVTAAAGGVGSLLVQLSRTNGAHHVVAAASTAQKLSLARTLGADVTVDYTKREWVDDLSEATGGIDVVFDGVGGQLGLDALSLVEPQGRYVRYGAASGTMTDVDSVAVPGVTVIPGYAIVRSPDDNRALVEQALAEAAAGRLRVVIGQTFPLSQAAHAHAAIEARATVGKTVLIPDPR
jgi:NADPH2:quinone reductase